MSRAARQAWGITAFVVILAAVSLYGTATRAQEPTIPQCAGAADMMAQLSEKWGESPVVMGMVGPEMFTWFANPATGTWTATVTRLDGQMCVLTSGNNHRQVPNV